MNKFLRPPAKPIKPADAAKPVKPVQRGLALSRRLAMWRRGTLVLVP